MYKFCLQLNESSITDQKFELFLIAELFATGACISRVLDFSFPSCYCKLAYMLLMCHNRVIRNFF